MENEDLVSVSQVNDEFTLISLFFRADIVVRLVILILFASSIFSWTIIIHKIRLFRSLKEISKQFEEEFWSGRSIKEITSSTRELPESPIKYVFNEAVDEIEKSNQETTKKIDSLVNRRIKEIAKKIKFNFDKNDEKEFFSGKLWSFVILTPLIAKPDNAEYNAAGLSLSLNRKDVIYLFLLYSG